MSLFTLLAVILLAGVVVFLIRSAPFIDPPYKQFACWFILACVVIWIAYTLLGPFPNIRVPALHR